MHSGREDKRMAEKKKDKRITAEEIRAMAQQADALKAMGDEDIVKHIEEVAEQVSKGDLNEFLQGMQDIIDSDNAESSAK
jgi:hypothetical protein